MGTHDSRQRLGYRPALDGLRGVAIIAVVLYHLRWPLPGGFLGVDLFFVLSGFLITRLAADEWHTTGNFDLRAFYIRRVRRLAPALLGAAVICATALPVLPALMARDTALSLVGAVTYSGNWLKAFDLHTPGGGGLLWHAWSLAIEEQFYLVWPAVLLLTLRRGRSALRIALVAAAVSAAVRIGMGLAAADANVLYYTTFTRLDGIMVGCALGLLPALPRVSQPVAVTAAATWALLVVAVPNHAYMTAATLTVSTIAGTALVARTVEAPWGWLTHPALVRIGRLSYGLYLWHQPVFKVGRMVWPASSMLRDLLFLAVAWGLTEASWRMIERRFTGSRSGTAPRPAGRTVLST